MPTHQATTFPVFSGDFGPGSFTSPSTVVPVGTTGLEFSVSMSQVQVDDPTTDFTYTVERLDADQVWRVEAAFEYAGGVNQGDGGATTPTTIQFDTSVDPGKTLRATVSSKTRLTAITAIVKFI